MMMMMMMVIMMMINHSKVSAHGQYEISYLAT